MVRRSADHAAVERGITRLEVEITMTRRTISVLAVLTALTLAACGGGGGAGGGEFADFPTSATVEPGNEETTYDLAPANRYRMTIQEDCDDYTISITQVEGEFTYEISNSPIRIVFVNDVPGGTFNIQQTNPDCTDWSLELTRVSGG
jgi:hypothetical protein